MLALIGGVIVFTGFSSPEGGFYDDFYIARAAEDVGRLSTTTREYRMVNGEWPILAELRAEHPSLPSRDRWQGEFAFDVEGDWLAVSCAGPDGILGNRDDVGGTLIPVEP